jgi:glutaminyl-peptide cyclotransferase
MWNRSKVLWGILSLIAIGGLAVWAQHDAARARAPASLEARAIAQFPHDPRAFTQGLVFLDGELYESTGQYGRSSIRHVDLETGAVSEMRPLNQALFGEGLAARAGKLYQLTWQNGLGIVYDSATLNVLETFRYAGEGWGLTYDGESLVLSDGTPVLRFLDPDTFEVRRTLQVTGSEGPVQRLNELEYVDGEIWANVWYEDFIVRIDPANGRVVGTIDVSSLYPATARDREAVANGIAYDPASSRLFLTGKYWPTLFEVELVPDRR